MPEKERLLIRQKFYRYFSRLVVEGLKNLSISEKELKKRIIVENPEILEELAKDKRSLLLVGGHYGNWEWLITAQALLFHQHAIGLGKPLSNSFLNEQVNARRGRFGMDIVHAGNYKPFLEKQYPNGFAMLTLTDQSPGDSKKSFWTEFLGQETAVLFGAEQIAHSYGLAVVFFEMKPAKKGFYKIKLHLICEDPKTLNYGEITEKHTRLLENQITKCPEYWLWSHKRWKREIPEDKVALMENHKARFNEQFKSNE